jgi:hypothetical protein
MALRRNPEDLGQNRPKKADSLILSLTFLSPGIKYKKFGRPKIYKLLERQPKKAIGYILNPVRGVSISARVIGM